MLEWSHLRPRVGGSNLFAFHQSEPSDKESKQEITECRDIAQQACINATNGTVHLRVSF